MTYVSEISKWWVYPHGSLLFSSSLLSSWIYGKSCLENVYRDLIYMRKNAQNGLCGPEEINRALLTSQMITQTHHSRMIKKGSIMNEVYFLLERRCVIQIHKDDWFFLKTLPCAFHLCHFTVLGWSPFSFSQAFQLSLPNDINSWRIDAMF